MNIEIDGETYNIDIAQAKKLGIITPTFYRIGERFRYNDAEGEEYILAQTGPKYVSLISLKDGNRWREAVLVEKLHEITQKEFEMIAARNSNFFVRIS